jgi:hypothetical protein
MTKFTDAYHNSAKEPKKSKGKGKGKVHPFIGYEGPEVE